MKRIFQVKVHGHITDGLVRKVNEAMQKFTIYRPEFLAVTVNSSGGSLVQARNLAYLLQQYSKKLDTPIYCFGEDAVISSAMLVLTAGTKVYANPYSLLGDFGFTQRYMNLEGNAQRWMYQSREYVSGDRKSILNPYKPLQQHDVDWVNGILKHKESQLIQLIEKSREDIFVKKDYQNRVEQMYEAGLVTADTANKLGLIDGTLSLEQLIEDRYHGTKIHKVFDKTVDNHN